MGAALILEAKLDRQHAMRLLGQRPKKPPSPRASAITQSLKAAGIPHAKAGHRPTNYYPNPSPTGEGFYARQLQDGQAYGRLWETYDTIVSVQWNIECDCRWSHFRLVPRPRRIFKTCEHSPARWAHMRAAERLLFSRGFDIIYGLLDVGDEDDRFLNFEVGVPGR